MNFLHLKYLIEVEKYESISKAAQHLYINQPRLSKIIKEIEEEANIKIFERHNKGVVPTTKGREFLSQAKKIVQEVDYLKNMYQDDPHKLNLDICVPRSSYISEAFIEYLKMDNNMKKELNLNYRETNSFDTIQNVYDGENNLGIVRFPLRDQDYYFNILNLKELTYEKLFTFDYQILISKDNPLKDKDIYMKDLKKQIELKHGDIHIQEDHHNHKHMNIYERGIQFELLNEIPETYMWAIVLYDRRQPHAVLLTDYTDGVFYCSDPAGSVSSGRVPISAASISIAGASCYWYISSDHNSAVATLDSLRLEGMRYPVNIRTGKGMSVSGTAASASSAVLSSVEAVILDANDQPVQSAEASPNVSSWSLKNFDSQLRFGELPEGSYTYMVVLTDSNGQTLCFMSDFTVSGSASSTATYWTVQDPSGTKLGQLVQETEEAVAEAVESEAEAVTETKKGLWSWLLG